MSMQLTIDPNVPNVMEAMGWTSPQHYVDTYNRLRTSLFEGVQATPGATEDNQIAEGALLSLVKVAFMEDIDFQRTIGIGILRAIRGVSPTREILFLTLGIPVFPNYDELVTVTIREYILKVVDGWLQDMDNKVTVKLVSMMFAQVALAVFEEFTMPQTTPEQTAQPQEQPQGQGQVQEQPTTQPTPEPVQPGPSIQEQVTGFVSTPTPTEGTQPTGFVSTPTPTEEPQVTSEVITPTVDVEARAEEIAEAVATTIA